MNFNDSFIPPFAGARDIINREEKLAWNLHRAARYFGCLINYRLFNISAVARYAETRFIADHIKSQTFRWLATLQAWKLLPANYMLIPYQPPTTHHHHHTLDWNFMFFMCLSPIDLLPCKNDIQKSRTLEFMGGGFFFRISTTIHWNGSHSMALG